MNRILIDTNVYSGFKRNDPRVVPLLKRAEYIGINTIVLGELIGGFKCGNKLERNLEELHAFLESPRVSVLDIDEDTAEFFGEIYMKLKKKGKPIPSNDMWIAASAMRHGLSMFTLDEHFRNIEGLAIEIASTGD